MTDNTVETTQITTPGTQPDQSAWALLRRPGQAHPALLHPWLVTGWAGVAGLGIAAADLDGAALAGVTAVTGLVGAAVGGACLPGVPGEPTHWRPLAIESGLAGTAAGLGLGLWGATTTLLGMWEDPLQLWPWAALAGAGALWGSWYYSLRGRIARVRAGGAAGETLIQRLTTRASGGEYAEVLERVGLAGTVEAVTPGHAGASERVTVTLDSGGGKTSATVAAMTPQIMGAVAGVLHERRGVSIPQDAVRVEPDPNDALRLDIEVRLRQPLVEVLSAADGEDITTPVTDPDRPIVAGLYLSGRPLLVPEAGPHGMAIGASGSGKSTYLLSLIIGWLRRPHVSVWVAGTDKFAQLVEPLLAPWADGHTSQSPIALIGGGDDASETTQMSAVHALMAAYLLYRHRVSTVGRADRVNRNVRITPERPRVILIIDEIDGFLRRGTDGRTPIKYQLPNGERMSISEMLQAITSKGRSEGVELEVGAQRTTDKFTGAAWQDIATNMQRRALFRTGSSHDAGQVLKGHNVDPTKIALHTMLFAAATGGTMEPAKSIFYTDDDFRRCVVAADRDNRIGALSGAEAAALGPLWSERWASLPPSTTDMLGISHLCGHQAAPTRRVMPTPGPTGGIETTAPGRSARLDAVLARAQAELAARADVDDQAPTEDALYIPESWANASLTVPRDADQDAVLTAVITATADRDDITTDEALTALGWLTTSIPDEDAPERSEWIQRRNAMAADLRKTLSAAVGRDVQRHISRPTGRTRGYRRTDLLGGSNGS